MLELALDLWSAGSCMVLEVMHATAGPFRQVVTMQDVAQVCQAYISILCSNIGVNDYPAVACRAQYRRTATATMPLV